MVSYSFVTYIFIVFCTRCMFSGAHGATIGWDTALHARRLQVWFLMGSLEFFVDIILPATMALGSSQPLNRKEYQEYFMGHKAGQCLRLIILPPSCANCLEFWERQPPGTLRSFPGLLWDCFTFICIVVDIFYSLLSLNVSTKFNGGKD